jgi:hypothetical protein
MSAPRRASGEFVIELPMVLGIIFFLLMFPLLNLVSSTARAYCLRQACMEAVHRACKMECYINDIPANPNTGEPLALSANHMAQNSLRQFLNAGYLGGSTVVIPQTLTAIQVAKSNGAATYYNQNPNQAGTPLTTVNTFNNDYYLEIRTRVTALPLIPMNVEFANIPGLTGPITMDVNYRQVCEHPMGLRI